MEDGRSGWMKRGSERETLGRGDREVGCLSSSRGFFFSPLFISTFPLPPLHRPIPYVPKQRCNVLKSRFRAR
jgi:hypothetical protein